MMQLRDHRVEIEKLRDWRHDMSNHFTTLVGNLEERDESDKRLRQAFEDLLKRERDRDDEEHKRKDFSEREIHRLELQAAVSDTKWKVATFIACSLFVAFLSLLAAYFLKR